jgi:hypothetical protein
VREIKQVGSEVCVCGVNYIPEVEQINDALWVLYIMIDGKGIEQGLKKRDSY